MSYGELVDSLAAAMAYDAFQNPDKVEEVRVSEQDVSDCPDVDPLQDLIVFEITEDLFEDIAHEMAMEELQEFVWKEVP